MPASPSYSGQRKPGDGHEKPTRLEKLVAEQTAHMASKAAKARRQAAPHLAVKIVIESLPARYRCQQSKTAQESNRLAETCARDVEVDGQAAAPSTAEIVRQTDTVSDTHKCTHEMLLFRGRATHVASKFVGRLQRPS